MIFNRIYTRVVELDLRCGKLHLAVVSGRPRYRTLWLNHTYRTLKSFCDLISVKWSVDEMITGRSAAKYIIIQNFIRKVPFKNEQYRPRTLIWGPNFLCEVKFSHSNISIFKLFTFHHVSDSIKVSNLSPKIKEKVCSKIYILKFILTKKSAQQK